MPATVAAPLPISRIRDLYSWATGWRAEDRGEDEDLSNIRESLRSEFDHALAAHDEQTRTEERERLTSGAPAVEAVARQIARLRHGRFCDWAGGLFESEREACRAEARSILAAAAAA